MSKQKNICLSGNNSTLQPTAQSSEMDYITSLQIAEITGKQHSNIMRDIRNLLEQLEDRAAFNFELGTYKDANNQERPCYRLTKKDSLLLASGYDANLRAKIINRWEELETEKQAGGYKVPQSFKEALLLAAHQQERIEEQQKQIEQAKQENAMKDRTINAQATELKAAAPKVRYVDDVLQSVNTYTSTQIAKEIGMDAAKFHKALKEIFLKIFRFFFGNMKIMRNFATLQDGSRICSVGQPVKLLKVDLGIFYAPYFNI